MADERQLRTTRSLLILLLATSRQTLLALDGIGNEVDDALAETLRTMIERSESELHVLNEKLGISSSTE